MQSIILAAGMGKRLRYLTKNQTKCMVKVNGVTLIERTLLQLEALNLSKIIIVIGYEGQNLKEYINTLNIKTPIIYIENSIYNKTNNIYSLFLAKEYLLLEDTLLLESDCIIEDSAFSKILNDKYHSLALVSKYESWMDGTVVTLDKNCNITRFIDKHHFDFDQVDKYYKTVNIYKFSKEFSTSHYVPFLEAYSKAIGNNEYYEQVLKVIALLDKPEIKALILEPSVKWYEIDDIQDLNIAESLFSTSPKEVNRRIQRRFGGFWRYPHLVDFCYLCNPYFPPDLMIKEIKASFTELLINYPSSLAVNNLLASRNYNVRSSQIIVGNGAAELIKVIMENLDGNLGIIFPTFEEYSNRLKEHQIIGFYPSNKDFSYNAEDIIEFYNDKEISTLLLINPDNPSGNFIDFEGIKKLLEWSQNKGVDLIIDESFVDFADDDKVFTLIDTDFLDENKNLIVIKSISKSYGVPGLRLGVVASSNVILMNEIRLSVSIWNINSFGEYFLQIECKYHNDYLDALKLFRLERKRYFDLLKTISYLRPIETQANFIMCELLDEKNSLELTETLLSNNEILIKDLSTKKGMINKQYIRLAVKSSSQNDNLIETLRSLN